MKSAIEAYAPQNNRSQRLVRNGHTILLDAYNANPTSMMAALENFRQTAGTNKMLILGDMFELGDDAALEHQATVDYLEKQPFETVFLVGNNFYATQTTAPHIFQFSTFGDFASYLRENKLEKATILVKGSRGMALERSLELL
jgi:UDP-N-acetylmuramoyl-tripeptide--D-alanyl-D-alanine ligase